MKCEYGVWFPDREEHLVMMLSNSPRIDGKGTYQTPKLFAALKHVKQFRLALDVGMHVGLWATHLVKRFQFVEGFEPVPEHRQCLHRNMDGIDNWAVHACALGDREQKVGLRLLDGSTGSTQVEPSVDQGIQMYPLDHFELENVDFIKIDVEGYEYFVVKGGERTIKECKPVIVIEQKPKGKAEHFGQPRFAAKQLLESWGAKTQFEMSGDFCLTW